MTAHRPDDHVRRARSWLFDQALPFWSDVGVDGDDGFVEHLTLEGQPAEVAYKRMRVQARQVYVFSHAHVLGFEPGLRAAECGWRFMRDQAWLPSGGWARRMGRQGGVLDPTLDLYEQAFALFAIAWWVRASNDTDGLAFADKTLEVIDDRLASPTGAGWLSEDASAAEHLQNPHMHLLEALLALYEVTGEERYAERAQAILALAQTSLMDDATGTLAEYFDDDWNRAPGQRGQTIEPGHHYEWVWLLHQARTLAESRAAADMLFAFAERTGVAPGTGLIYDEVLASGDLKSPSHRCWPQTEALKAYIVRAEGGDPAATGRIGGVVDNLFTHYLDPAPAGTWIDHIDAELQPQVEKIPASTLYHVFLAFSELLRTDVQS